jgi:hypothetical protein
MSILRDFYNGRILPYDDLSERAPSYEHISEEIEAEKNKWLTRKLSEEDLYRFSEELEPLYYKLGGHFEANGFTYGFKLGALMMIEVFTGNDDLFKSGK